MEGIFNILTIYLFIYATKAEFNYRYYPRIHLAPPQNQWMNDPNGFSYFENEYHLFYQNNPNSSLVAGTAHWGHAKSPDLVHWEHLPIALYPGEEYDMNGVFSGSALIEDGVMYLYYTGHVNQAGETPDHVERQALATSSDGATFTKYENNPVILGEEHQPEFRDPKVWKHGDKYYIVLGNAFENEQNVPLGRVLLYESSDKYNWSQVAVIAASDGLLGRMWECPDFFQLNGRFILLFSPQGVVADGDKYKNLYQTGYIVGDFDYTTYTFTNLTEFQELDHGHDFYATQTLLDNTGRRILVGWLDMWDQDYPEGEDGFTGMITIPRLLSLSKEKRLIQKPVSMSSARANMIRYGYASGSTSITLDDKAGEVNIRASVTDLELYIESENVSVVITYNATNGTISLDRGGDDSLRRTEWVPTGVLILNIYIDASSIELFCGSGEVVFSSRYFPPGAVSVRLGSTSEAEQFRVFNLNRTVDIY